MTLAAHGRRIAIAPVGEVDPMLVGWVAEDARAVVGRDIVVVAALPLPSHAFSRQRDQWRAAVILDALADAKSADWLCLLGIADVDLYAPDLNFVFGEADERRGVAVFSTACRSDDPPDRQRSTALQLGESRSGYGAEQAGAAPRGPPGPLPRRPEARPPPPAP